MHANFQSSSQHPARPVSTIHFLFYHTLPRLQPRSCVNMFNPVIHFTSPAGERMCRGHNPFLAQFPVLLLTVKRPGDALIPEVTGVSAEYAQQPPSKSHQEE